ncbi:acyl-CoA thioesterase-1 [Shimia isoporae]|uniref:Acyl-CoA thioesterase-1 n=1 Tax=Shimia isoporae TaxID=647720 RepID=A0A4R1NL67_9RHOB|nr:acyl-CoA thioesterase-1 [Shimia isoporae]
MENRSSLYGLATGWGKALAFSVFAGFGAGSVVAEPVVVAALGDSLTHGYGLPQGDGFVPQLSAWLSGEGVDVVVQNAGVSGDTTQGGLARVGWTLGPDVDAMIVALGGNDVLRGIDPGVSMDNLAGILDAAQAADVAVLLVGMTAPMNYGAEYKAAFDSMYGTLSEEYGVMLAPDFFEGLRDVAPEDLGTVMQPDGIHPNKEGVARIVALLGPYVAALVASAQ